MKIKTDFVTNSSSACFVLSLSTEMIDTLMDYIADLNEEADASNEGVQCYFSADTLKSLQEYTNDGPFDWASLPGGPQFIRMSESVYEICKTEIENNRVIAQVSVDYNVCDQFESKWKSEILKETT